MKWIVQYLSTVHYISFCTLQSLTKIPIRCIQPLSHFSGRCTRKMLITQVSPAAQPVLYCTVPRPRPQNCTAFIGLGLKYLSAGQAAGETCVINILRIHRPLKCDKGCIHLMGLLVQQGDMQQLIHHADLYARRVKFKNLYIMQAFSPHGSYANLISCLLACLLHS